MSGNIISVCVLLALFLTILVCAVFGIEPTDEIFKRKKGKK
jgi:hypothetical protein